MNIQTRYLWLSSWNFLNSFSWSIVIGSIWFILPFLCHFHLLFWMLFRINFSDAELCFLVFLVTVMITIYDLSICLDSSMVTKTKYGSSSWAKGVIPIHDDTEYCRGAHRNCRLIDLQQGSDSRTFFHICSYYLQCVQTTNATCTQSHTTTQLCHREHRFSQQPCGLNFT